MANRSRVITMSPIVLDHEDDGEIDLDLWEVVNPSDGQYSDDSYSVDSLSDDDVISLDNDASLLSPTDISPPTQMLPENDDGEDELAADLDLDLADHVDLDVDGDGDVDVFGDEDDKSDLGLDQQRMVLLREGNGRYSIGVVCGDYVDGDGCYNEDDDEDRNGDDEEYDDSYDLDDEPVLRSVSRKVGRQRMRKLGNRAIAKASTSKKTPYSHLKSEYARGKHGLSFKFEY